MSELFAIPPFKTHLDTENIDDQKRCQTASLYDDNTAITFFGDSRIDFVNNPGYGKSTIPSILNEPFGSAGAYSADLLFTEENIQNLGKEGYRSYDIVRHLDRCIPKLSENYKIAKRFVFYVGGIV